MDGQRKDNIDTKWHEQRNCSKQLQTHNLPTDDEENINRINKGRYLLPANKLQVVPRGTERVPQKIHRHSRVTLYRSLYHKWEQDLRKNLAMTWIDY